MKIETNFYTINAYDNICHIKVFLSWDERIMGDYLKHITEVGLNIYIGKKWAILMDMQEWELHTPDAEKMITQKIKKKSSIMPSACAYVVGESQLKKWQIRKSLPEESEFSAKCFGTLDEGKNWLTSLGYEMIPLDTQKKEEL